MITEANIFLCKNRSVLVGLLVLLPGYFISAALAQDSGESETPPAATATPQTDPAREAELRQMLEEFRKKDADGDGCLSIDEFKIKQVGGPEFSPEHKEQIKSHFFNMFDIDKDGKVCEYERVIIFNRRYDEEISKSEKQ